MVTPTKKAKNKTKKRVCGGGGGEQAILSQALLCLSLAPPCVPSLLFSESPGNVAGVPICGSQGYRQETILFSKYLFGCE